jgi:hypothetical protein
MPRPDRGWEQFTGTISPGVKRFLQQQADTWGVDPGTALDVLVWRRHLNPSTDSLRDDKHSREVLERCFAEEALAVLQDDRAVLALEEKLNQGEATGVIRRKVQALLRRWKKTRLIDQDFKASVLQLMRERKKSPMILNMGAVYEDWFEAGTKAR